MATKRSAKKRATSARTIKTSKGFQIRTYEPPPSDFNPLKASPRLLLRHGFPTRPDAKAEPELRRLWNKEFSRARTWIIPEFLEVKGKKHGPVQKLRRVSRAQAASATENVNATSANWSGSVAFAPANRKFDWIQGQWTVPNPHTAKLGAFFASEWIGIDGAGSRDVLQAGTETQILDVGIFKSKQVYVWWEWFPAGEVAITNLPVSAGDVMYCLICVNSPTSATIHLTNESSLVSTSFTIKPPSGTRLVGNSAEWIVERPSINGSTAKLTDFKIVYFDKGIAGLSGAPFTIVTLDAGTRITMVGNNNATLSFPTVETDQLMKVDWSKDS